MSYRIPPTACVLFVVSVGVLSVSCARRDRSTPTGQNSAGETTRKLENPKYDFERDPASVEMIRENIARAKIGDTPDHIVELLGPATDDWIDNPKSCEQN